MNPPETGAVRFYARPKFGGGFGGPGGGFFSTGSSSGLPLLLPVLKPPPGPPKPPPGPPKPPPGPPKRSTNRFVLRFVKDHKTPLK